MKSAYEKAMERLEQESGPSKSLSEEQRDAIGEIDRKYDAQAAEQKMHYDGELAQAVTPEAIEQLQAERATSLQSIEDRREREKQAVWDAG